MRKVSIPSLVVLVAAMGFVRAGLFNDLTGYLFDGSLLTRRQRTVEEFGGTNGIHLSLEGPDQDVLIVVYPQMTKDMAENFLRNDRKDGRVDYQPQWLTRLGFKTVRFRSDHEEWILDLSTGRFDR